MAPQESVPLVATVLGLIGTVLWCAQLLPQIWHSYHTKSTEGLPLAMMVIWSWSGLPFGVYAVTQNFNIPLQIQPQCFAVLCMANFGQCLVYSHKWRAWTSWLVCTIMLAVMGTLEVVLVMVLRGPYSRGVAWPVITMGIVACVTLLSGYIPIPFELVKRRGRVIGISFVFLVLDSFGALFSLMSLVAQKHFDIEFGVLYSLCVAIEYTMFISHGIWLLRTRDLRRRAKEAGHTFDTFDEAIAWQEKSFPVAWNRPRKFSRAFLPGERLDFVEDESRYRDEEDEEAVV